MTVTKVTEYFTTALIWSAIGLIVGFIAGVGVRVKWVEVIFRREDRERLFGLGLILIGLVAVAQNLYFQKHQRQITNCQTKYNVAFQTILTERANISDRDKDNLSYLINGIVTAKSKEDSKKIFNKYVVVNKQLDEERKSYKYPTLPRKDCR